MGEATSLALADDPGSAAEERAEKVFDRAREIAADYDTEFETVVKVGSRQKRYSRVQRSSIRSSSEVTEAT